MHAVARLMRAGRPNRLLNMYGPTEVTTLPAPVITRAADGLASIPIGRPIANTQAYILMNASAAAHWRAGELFLEATWRSYHGEA